MLTKKSEPNKVIIKFLSDKELKEYLLKIISGAVFDTHSELSKDEILMLTDRLFNDLILDFSFFTTQDIQISIRKGVRNEFGFYKTPISVKTIYGWFKQYNEVHRPKLVSAYIHEEQKEKPLTKEEENRLFKEAESELYKEFIQKVNEYEKNESAGFTFHDFGNYIYKKLKREKGKFFKFTFSQYREALKSAESILRADPSDREVLRQVYRNLEDIRIKNNWREKVKTEARRVLLKHYVDHVILPSKRNIILKTPSK